MPALALTNAERIAKGYAPVGRRPRIDSVCLDMPRSHHAIKPHREIGSAEQRLRSQICEMFGRANATLNRWKLGDR
jgi:hypothetical protein